jgi:ABC-2 type transport system ATP-binding protein
VPGEISLWSGLTGGETIDFLSRLRDINTDSKDYKNLKDKYAKLYDLDLSKKNKTYSKGNRQKVSLVSAFVSNAELLILDEPTSGLDPLMEEVFSQCVRDYKANGATVLLSSHILSEVEKLCDRVTILRNGKDVLCDSVESLKDKHKEGETLEDVFLKEYANV